MHSILSWVRKGHRTSGASVATRDMDDFEGSEIDVINPCTDE